MFALLRLLPVSNRDKDVEILALRHQITVLERRLRSWPPCSTASPGDLLGRFRLPVRPDTVLRSPGPDGPPPRSQITPKEIGPTAHRPLHPGTGAVPGKGEPVLGLPAHPWRTARPRHQGRRLYSVGDPPPRRDRSRARPRHCHLSQLPPLAGRRAARLRLLRDRHLNRRPPARAGSDRARGGAAETAARTGRS